MLHGEGACKEGSSYVITYLHGYSLIINTGMLWRSVSCSLIAFWLVGRGRGEWRERGGVVAHVPSTPLPT